MYPLPLPLVISNRLTFPIYDSLVRKAIFHAGKNKLCEFEAGSPD